MGSNCKSQTKTCQLIALALCRFARGVIGDNSFDHFFLWWSSGFLLRPLLLSDPLACLSSSTPAAPPRSAPTGYPVLAAVLAWLIPGLGHIYLKRWRRGLAFLLLVVLSIITGCALALAVLRDSHGIGLLAGILLTALPPRLADTSTTVAVTVEQRRR